MLIVAFWWQKACDLLWLLVAGLLHSASVWHRKVPAPSIYQLMRLKKTNKTKKKNTLCCAVCTNQIGHSEVCQCWVVWCGRGRHFKLQVKRRAIMTTNRLHWQLKLLNQTCFVNKAVFFFKTQKKTQTLCWCHWQVLTLLSVCARKMEKTFITFQRVSFFSPQCLCLHIKQPIKSELSVRFVFQRYSVKDFGGSTCIIWLKWNII